jgi:hypothetical protein
MARSDGDLVAGITAFADGPDEMREVIRHHVNLGAVRIQGAPFFLFSGVSRGTPLEISSLFKPTFSPDISSQGMFREQKLQIPPRRRNC